MAAAQGMGSGMMGNHGSQMMYASAPATRAGPNAAAARPGYYGMGRYGGYGMSRGMPGGYGMGYGMGPGMMGGYGMGYGMGPGMMGGSGMGYGMGPGMMYGYGGQALGLSVQQRENIAGIWNQSMQQSWPVMGELREQNFQLARLMNQETPDRADIDKAYRRMSDLRRKLLDQRLQARQRMLQVLTADQRKQLRQGFYGPRQ